MNRQKTLRELALLAAGAVYLPLGILSQPGSFGELVVMRLCISGVMALGLYYSAVYAGLLSLGQGAFMAIGAYGTAVCLRAGVPLPLAALAALGLCGFLALLLGWAVLGLKGDYLSMTTMAFAEIVRTVLFHSPALGGASGLFGVPTFLNGTGAALALFGSCILLFALMRTRFSRRLRAVKNDEPAAESLGIPTRGYKTWAFVISAGFAGLAGVLFAGCGGFVTPFDFSFLRSMDTVAAVVLGGMGAPAWCLAASAGIELSAVCLQSVSWVRMILYGLGLIAAVRLLHAGERRKLRKETPHGHSAVQGNQQKIRGRAGALPSIHGLPGGGDHRDYRHQRRRKDHAL